MQGPSSAQASWRATIVGIAGHLRRRYNGCEQKTMSGDREHWDNIYESKADSDLSWTEAEPLVSLMLIERAAPARARVMDVGGGSSLLAGRLLDRGYQVTVLDISAPVLQRARQALGSRGDQIRWITADVTQFRPTDEFDVWHDRAVFHFLIDADDRRAYARAMAASMPAGGHAIIATFSLEGPEKCSGLPVRRYDAEALAREFAPEFSLIQSLSHTHHTPWGKPQAFQYCLLRRERGDCVA